MHGGQASAMNPRALLADAFAGLLPVAATATAQ
jgi:hypothetical protein